MRGISKNLNQCVRFRSCNGFSGLFRQPYGKSARRGGRSTCSSSPRSGYTERVVYLRVSSRGGGGGSFANAYVAYYNDGINEIRVVAEYKDDPVDVAKMKQLAPKDDLRALALSFMDVYTHAW